MDFDKYLVVSSARSNPYGSLTDNERINISQKKLPKMTVKQITQYLFQRSGETLNYQISDPSKFFAKLDSR